MGSVRGSAERRREDRLYAPTEEFVLCRKRDGLNVFVYVGASGYLRPTFVMKRIVQGRKATESGVWLAEPLGSELLSGRGSLPSIELRPGELAEISRGFRRTRWRATYRPPLLGGGPRFGHTIEPFMVQPDSAWEQALSSLDHRTRKVVGLDVRSLYAYRESTRSYTWVALLLRVPGEIVGGMWIGTTSCARQTGGRGPVWSASVYLVVGMCVSRFDITPSSGDYVLASNLSVRIVSGMGTADECVIPDALPISYFMPWEIGASPSDVREWIGV